MKLKSYNISAHCKHLHLLDPLVTIVRFIVSKFYSNASSVEVSGV